VTVPGATSSLAATFFIEEGSQSASFVLQWIHPEARANMIVRDPTGTTYQTQDMPQGRFLQVAHPVPGDWEILIDAGGIASPFVVRAYARNPSNHVSVGVRYPSIIPNGDIFVYAYPTNMGLAVTSDQPILATVIHPDGSTDSMELYDRGCGPSGTGDDVPGDGVFTGMYGATGLTGAYQFLVKTAVDGWVVSTDAHEYQNQGPSTRVTREAQLSTAVNDPNVVETTPEDDERVGAGEQWCERYLCFILAAILLLLLLNLWLTFRCAVGRGMRSKQSPATESRVNRSQVQPEELS
jgi:hypothetical protein